MMEQQVTLTRDERIFLIECMIMSSREGYYLSNCWKLFGIERLSDWDVVKLAEKLFDWKYELDEHKDLEDSITDDMVKEAFDL